MQKNILLKSVCLLLISTPAMAYDTLFLNGNNPLSIQTKNKGFYGTDDRKEFFEVSDKIKKISASVPAFMFSDRLRLDSSGRYYHLKSQKNINICEDAAFSRQPQTSFCSGFVIDDNKIASAGHCMVDKFYKPYTEGDACDDIRIVFGYQLNAQGEFPTKIPVEDVYRCKSILSKQHIKGVEDYAVLSVDRAISSYDHPALAISGDKKIANDASVTVMGYPYGLPLKIAGGATVKQNHENNHFVTDLDTFGGNSGSPVFSTPHLINGEAKVEGLLVRGGTDFIRRAAQGCDVPNRCDAQQAGNKDCNGEGVTRINKVQNFAKFIYSRPVTERLEISTRKQKVKYGDELEIVLTLPKQGYLNVMEMNPEGGCTVLFPNKMALDNKMQAGTFILSEGTPWKLTIQSGPYGEHSLYAIFSEEPFSLYQKNAKALQAFAPCSVNDLVTASKGALPEKRIQYNECEETRGAGPTSRCQAPAPSTQIKSTQVCYFKSPSDCR